MMPDAKAASLPNMADCRVGVMLLLKLPMFNSENELQYVGVHRTYSQLGVIDNFKPVVTGEEPVSCT
jgi:hypothetical protein